jgi:hypothetical protein
MVAAIPGPLTRGGCWQKKASPHRPRTRRIGNLADGENRALKEGSAGIRKRQTFEIHAGGSPVTFAIRRSLALSAALIVVAGCGSGDEGTAPETSPSGTNTPAGTNTPLATMRLLGSVRSQPSVGGVPVSLQGAEVKATIDRNRDGAISDDETYSATTDADGAYTLDVPVDAGDTVVVRFAIEGSVPMLQTLDAAPKTSMILNARLRQFESLDCVGTACALREGSLALRGLPPGTRGGARVFNPVSETDAFPGEFKDSSGNLIVPGVFASFDLEDDAGTALHQLAGPAEIRIRMPREVWAAVSDVTLGNNQIDVPLYSFDEVKGLWLRDPGLARLQDGNGTIIAPSSIASIRDGTFAGAQPVRDYGIDREFGGRDQVAGLRHQRHGDAFAAPVRSSSSRGNANQSTSRHTGSAGPWRHGDDRGHRNERAATVRWKRAFHASADAVAAPRRSCSRRGASLAC